MTQQSPPSWQQNSSHTAEQTRRAVFSMLPPTVGGLTNAVGGVVGATDYLVGAGSGNSLTVLAGQVIVPGTQAAAQSLYYAYNDGTVTLPVVPNSVNPLVAIVCVTVNDAAYSGSTNNVVLQVVQGTPASSPVAPATPANSYVLAQVLVPANASSSSAYTITSTLTTAGARPSGHLYAAAATSMPASTETQVVSLVTDYLSGGMTASSNELVIPTNGIYLVCARLAFGVTSGTLPVGAYAMALRVGSTDVRSTQTNSQGGYFAESLSIVDTMILDSGNTLSMWATTSASGTQIDGGVPDGFVTSLSATLLSTHN